ncbi:MAG TPA: phosphatidate cytidylyltransferase [Bdellovibrionales bacterium]|nr:phosphatidate cytidylyltransferase [Bdellovibrionales bacterium]
MSNALWNDPLYRETVYLVVGVLFVVGLGLFPLRNKNTHTQAHWASLKSWLFAAPVLMGLCGLPAPWPLFILCLVGINGAKIFFQMMGMYHRSNFVWMTYVGVIALGVAIHYDLMEVYNLAPMIFLGTICMIPILRNSPKQMVQYLALALMGFSFLGWAFMHLGWIWKLERGPYMVIYLIILTEVCDNMYLLLSRHIGKIKPFSKISPKRNLEAGIIAFGLTLLLAWSMRHLLPVRSETFWVASGLVAAFGGSLGDLVLSVIRRDLGIKDVGPFIIGRGDLLTIMDRMIFVAPIFYYVMWYLQKSAQETGAL